MQLIKRVLIVIVIILLMNIWGYCRSPQLDTDDIYCVTGKCVDVISGSKYRQPKLVMETGEAYSYSAFTGYTKYADYFKDQYVSFCVSDKLLLSNQIVAWNENDVIKEKTLDAFNKNSVRGYVFMTIASLIVSGFLFVRPVLEKIQEYDERQKREEAKKRKEAKKQKKQKQRQKIDNADDLTR